ncbi:MAG: ABC transporter ATP-binding protein [Syntrophorhabdaceae bacterium]|nr:ABC transporter ATP-binding protein [Syntrophorhabdaceae bacterium]
MEEGLLEISNLNVAFFAGKHPLPVIEDLSLKINRGDIMGLVGESGCGKTMTALSVMGLIPPPGRVVSGKIIFEGLNLTSISGKEMEKIRGNRIGMIFQEPMVSLNPVLRIGEQIRETVLAHRESSKKKATEITLDLLRKVGFDDPEKRYLQYPHQLSGGQRQRVLIAIAISCMPSLIIADEPTTALDVATESQILTLLKGLIEENGLSMLYITHNLNSVRRLCNKVAIMYAGRVVEEGSVDNFFYQPLHPYSKGLLDSILGFTGNERRIKTISGNVPNLADMPGGCKFNPRCSFVMKGCTQKEPPIMKGDGDRWVRCYLYQG